jgi:hypothetical protein
MRLLKSSEFYPDWVQKLQPHVDPLCSVVLLRTGGHFAGGTILIGAQVLTGRARCRLEMWYIAAISG